MNGRDTYHHGDLRAALLRAAEELLDEIGLHSFSLRRVARKVGVSHSAPAHHFGDASGLLFSLAQNGFERLVERMKQDVDQADNAETRVKKASIGYVDFAVRSPSLFELMYRSDFSDAQKKELVSAFEATQACFKLGGSGSDEAQAQASWSMAHGIAGLAILGAPPSLADMDASERSAFVERLLGQA